MDDEEHKLKITQATAYRAKRAGIYFEEMEDGTWHVKWNSNYLGDIRKLQSLFLTDAESTKLNEAKLRIKELESNLEKTKKELMETEKVIELFMLSEMKRP